MGKDNNNENENKELIKKIKKLMMKILKAWRKLMQKKDYINVINLQI